MKKAYLLLADGTLFEGTAVGYEGQSIGEVVFNTGMAGYQEVLTDPSYYGQVVTMTYPLVGNYGINFDDYESRKSWVSGFIMREMCEYPSNWRCKVTLDEYLKAQKVVGLAGIDTRRLTRKLRGEGVMNGVIYTEGFEPDEQTVAAMRDAPEGATVVRLHTGDPCLYGAIAEQMRELDKLGLAYEVVPGVSSFCGAAAAIPAEYTPAEVSQTLIITRMAGRTPVPEQENLRALASHRASMTLFLSVSMLKDVCAELTAGGYPEDTPVAVVYKATWPEQEVVRGTLADIAEKAAHIKKTALILVGDFLRESDKRSKLYDPAFAHACREAETP